MAEFEKALEYTLKWEGGYSNHPSDRGGATKYGVTQATLARWRDKPVSVEDVAALTLPEAAKIYRTSYWFFGAIESQRLATKIFDMGVNLGPPRAIRLLQSALNKMHAAGLRIDGLFGIRTLEETNQAKAEELLAMLVAECVDYYSAIVAANPSQAVFFKGWTRRAQMLPEE